MQTGNIRLTKEKETMLGVKLPLRQLIKATDTSNANRKESHEPYLNDQIAQEVLVKLAQLTTKTHPSFRRILTSPA